MSLAALNAKILSSASRDCEVPVEIGLGVDGERLGAALAMVAVDSLSDSFEAKGLHGFQFLGMLAHFTAVGLDLLMEELRLTREGRSPVLVDQFMWRARTSYRAGVLAFMDSNLEEWGNYLGADRVAFAREMLPGMLGAHLFPGQPHPFSQDEKDAMIQLYAGLEVLARLHRQEMAA